MAKFYEAKIGKKLFEITYFPGTCEFNVHHQPSGSPHRRYQMLSSTICGGTERCIEELGPYGKAKAIRAALPQLQQHSELPENVRKALSSIQL